MLSQSLPNACNSNFKGSLRPRLSFHWSFLSLHSKFMCRVELQGSFKPLKWFAEQPVELECGRCLNHLWTSLSRRGAVFVNSYYCSRSHSSLLVHIAACRLPPGRCDPLDSNSGPTWPFKWKAMPLGKRAPFVSILTGNRVIIMK